MSRKIVEKTFIKPIQVINCDLCGEEIEPDVLNSITGTTISTKKYDIHTRCFEMLMDNRQTLNISYTKADT